MEINVGQAAYRDGAWAEFRAKTLVYFEDRPVQDMPATKQHGRPIFKNRVHIIKVTPGDRLLRVERYMRDQDKIDFPDEWAKYEKKHDAKPTGTPLEALPILTATQRMELVAFNLHTVEQLAAMSDSIAQKFMGGQMFREHAQRFIKGQHSEDVLLAEISDLKKQVAALMQSKEAAPKKKGGRPKKVKADGANSPPVGNSSV